MTRYLVQGECPEGVKQLVETLLDLRDNHELLAAAYTERVRLLAKEYKFTVREIAEA